LSAKQKPKNQQIQSERKVTKSSSNGQFVKDFSATESVFFVFFTIGYNTNICLVMVEYVQLTEHISPLEIVLCNFVL